LTIDNQSFKSLESHLNRSFYLRGQIYPSYKIDSSLQLTRAIYRRFCRWRPVKLQRVRHSIQISCNFRRNVQSVDKRDVLVTLTPTPHVIGGHCLLQAWNKRRD